MPLDLPEPDPARLAHSPLELVVCQIRFENPPTPRDSRAALAVHQALGGNDGPYPRIDQVQALNVTIGQLSPVPETNQAAGWRFASIDGSVVVSLMPDHVALETSRYATWAEDFRERLAVVIDAVAEHVRPAFEQRVGLRYIDRISELELTRPQEWEPYIRSELLGLALHPQLRDQIQAAQQQVLLDLGDDVRCGLRHGFIAGTPAGGNLDYLLDFDLYREGGRPFDAVGVKALADQLNVYALQLFQLAATPALLERLR